MGACANAQGAAAIRGGPLRERHFRNGSGLVHSVPGPDPKSVLVMMLSFGGAYT